MSRQSLVRSGLLYPCTQPELTSQYRLSAVSAVRSQDYALMNWSHSQGQSLMQLTTVSGIMACYSKSGGVAQMVERSLSMREVPGSIPGASTNFFYSNLLRSLHKKKIY